MGLIDKTKKINEMVKKQDRVSTGIKGLDEVMQGGFEKNSINLVGGGAGSGKTIFCVQFLIDGIKNNEPGILISFEESKNKLYKHMKEFGWDLAKFEQEGKFVFVEYSPEQVKQLLSEGGGTIDAAVEKIKAKRLVIDSLTAFTLLYDSELAKRESLLDLFKLISKWECTALLTSEEDIEHEDHKSSLMEFEVDGVILFYYIRKGDARKRAIEILKIRGSKHASKMFPMRITDKGIVIYPEETVF